MLFFTLQFPTDFNKIDIPILPEALRLDQFSFNVDLYEVREGVNGALQLVRREGGGGADGTSFSELRQFNTYDEVVDWTYEYGYGDYEGACNYEEEGHYKGKSSSESVLTTDISYDAESMFGEEGNSVANHLIGIGTNSCKSGYDSSYDYHWECSGCGGCSEYNESSKGETESVSKFLDYDKMTDVVGFGQDKIMLAPPKYGGFSGSPSVGSSLGTASPVDSGGGLGGYYYYYDGYYYGGYYGSYYGGYDYPNSQETVSVAGISVGGGAGFGNYADIDVEALLTPPPAVNVPASGGVNPLTIPNENVGSSFMAGVSGFFSGLQTGVKAVVNGTTSALSTLGTVGAVDWKPMAVTEIDMFNGYGTAEGFAKVGANAAIAAGTMGVGCAAAQSSKLASGAVAAVDTLEGLGAGRDLVEGGTDMIKNGVTLENLTKVGSSLLTFVGLGGRACFTAGTQVVVGVVDYSGEGCGVEYVTTNIEDIKVGDYVLTQDVETGEVSLKAVTDTFIRTSDHLRYLTTIDEDGDIQTFETTDAHPFWVVTDNSDLSRAAGEFVVENGAILYHENLAVTEHGYYVEAKDLKVGDVFIGANGELTTLTATERVEYPNGITVYNFSVEGNHNYYVIANFEAYQNGASVVLVHNTSLDYKRLSDSELARRAGIDRSELHDLKKDIIKDAREFPEVLKWMNRISGNPDILLSLDGLIALAHPKNIKESIITTLNIINYGR